MRDVARTAMATRGPASAAPRRIECVECNDNTDCTADPAKGILREERLHGLPGGRCRGLHGSQADVCHHG
jgi:hypothetical protein